MAKTSGGAQRHVREICELFGAVNAVGCAVVEELLARHDRKKYLRQSLQRLQVRDLISKSGDAYKLTPKGILFFSRYRKRKKIDESRTKWDGKWRLISFDVPVKENAKRFVLLRALKESDFYQLQKSVWIAPYKMSEEFWKFVVTNNLHSYCKVMLIDVLEGDRELKRHFHLA